MMVSESHSWVPTHTTTGFYSIHYDTMHFCSIKKYPRLIIETYRNQTNCMLIFFKNYKALKKVFANSYWQAHDLVTKTETRAAPRGAFSYTC